MQVSLNSVHRGCWAHQGYIWVLRPLPLLWKMSHLCLHPSIICSRVWDPVINMHILLVQVLTKRLEEGSIWSLGVMLMSLFIRVHILECSRKAGRMFEDCMLLSLKKKGKWLYHIFIMLFSTSGLFYYYLHFNSNLHRDGFLEIEQTIFTFGFLSFHYVVYQIAFKSTVVMFTFALLFHRALPLLIILIIEIHKHIMHR